MRTARPRPARRSVSPILRWAGSKRRLVPALLEAAPLEFNRYFEPFAGSACFFLALNPPLATISDYNSQLIRTYNTVSRHSTQVGITLHSLPCSKEDYYRIREQTKKPTSDILHAAHFLYLNRYCFNGIYRENRFGEFNVPFGSRVGKIPSLDHIRSVGSRMYRATLRHGDFETVLQTAEKGDFAYLDPPYLTTDRPSFGEYGYGTYRNSEVNRLERVLKELDSRGVNVLLSYRADTDLLESLSNWSSTHIEVKLNIAGNSSKRLTSTEILASNYKNLDQIRFEGYQA